MRTSSPSHSKKRFSVRMRVVISVCAVVAGLFLFGGVFGAWNSYLTSPLFSLKVWINTSKNPVSSFFRTHTTLQSEIDRLKGALADSAYDTARLQILEQENDRLRGGNSDGSRIVADVVTLPNETPYDTLLINRGASDGVQEGALVYNGTIAIGSIARVYPKSSFAVLFSTPRVESPVYVYGRARVFARAVGEGGGVLRVGVPQGVQLTVGDPVVVPASATDIYGTIAYIESDPSNPDQYGFVTQAESLTTLRTVLVAREPAPTLSLKEARAIVANLDMSTTTTEALIEVVPIATTTASSTHP